MKKVLIMLSTYNGEKYLPEQLDSLYAQEGVDIHILVRDDGSQDSTLRILKEYKEKRDRMTIFAEPNVGAATSFFYLIDIASKQFREYDYFAFSDQDDIWFNNKIAIGVRALEGSSSTIKLFYSFAQDVDERLVPIHNTLKIHSHNTFASKLISSHILGCTMLMNLPLLDKVVRGVPVLANTRPTVLHDSWTSIVAYSLNGDIICHEVPLMYYRQHGGNVVGGSKSLYQMQINRIFRYIKNPCIKSHRCKLVLRVLDKDITLENKELITLCAYYQNSLQDKLKLLTEKRIYTNDTFANVGLFFMILFNRF
jgi:rhamnosyltransferase